MKSTESKIKANEKRIKENEDLVARQGNALYDTECNIDEINQYLRRDCLEITGTPVIPEDNPKLLAIQLSSLLGVELNENSTSTAYRLPDTTKLKNRIIVKFVHRDTATAKPFAHIFNESIFTGVVPDGITSWGSTYKSRLNKLISKQNKFIRNILFAHSRESSDPYYKLLDLLKLDNIFKLKIATFTHKILNIKECIAVIFSDFVLPAASIHSHIP